MKALVAYRYGPPEELAMADLDRPKPGPGQVLLKVEAAGVNPADFKLVTGEHRGRWPLAFPFVPGLDVAGTVEEMGEGATRFALGDRVFGMLLPSLGGFAQYALATDESTLMGRRPDGLDPVRAAALPTVGLTASVLVERAALRPGDARQLAVQECRWGPEGGESNPCLAVRRCWPGIGGAVPRVRRVVVLGRRVRRRPARLLQRAATAVADLPLGWARHTSPRSSAMESRRLQRIGATALGRLVRPA
jgi:Alcohol dehydrogenase GroES-like domain